MAARDWPAAAMGWQVKLSDHSVIKVVPTFPWVKVNCHSVITGPIYGEWTGVLDCLEGTF
jgi:hypothetical protein